MGTPAAPIVIYGDFTAHHVIVTGSPPLPAGVIDFERAHLDEPAADIGYGLWRSGRPRQDASHLDLARLSLFIRGYATMARIPQQTVRALPVYLHGRGVQMIAKRIRAGRAETGMLAQIQWLTANAVAVGDALATAVG